MKTIDIERTILTDVDGVLLNWDNAFHQWLVRNGFENSIEEILAFKEGNGSRAFYDERHGMERIALFNSSAEVGFLRPFRDAVNGIRRLSEDGYRFIPISSFSTNIYSHALRRRNLTDLFGEKTFIDFHMLPLGASKKDALSHYAGTAMLWIDDSPKHVEMGMSLGLQSFLMRDWHTKDYNGPAMVVENWADIVRFVKTEKKVLHDLRVANA